MLQATLSNPLALKVATALATVILIALLFFVRYLGKKLSRTKKNGMYDRRLLSWHRWAVGCAAFAGLVTISLIERLINRLVRVFMFGVFPDDRNADLMLGIS